MALREELESWGNWLFRWRSYLPLAVISIFFLGMGKYEYPGHSERLAHLWEGLCLMISFFGLFIRIVTVGHTPKGTSGRNKRKQIAYTLNTTGAYSIVRHPLYLGNFFMGLGIALFPHIWWIVFIYILFFSLYYERIMFTEEEFLRHKFGKRFHEWANKTPAIIPTLKNYQRPELPFSFKDSIKREYNGFFAVIVLMFFLKTTGNTIVHGELKIDLMWTYILAFGCTIWTVLIILKKFTNALTEKGR